jgi:hypothetical protein
MWKEWTQWKEWRIADTPTDVRRYDVRLHYASGALKAHNVNDRRWSRQTRASAVPAVYGGGYLLFPTPVSYLLCMAGADCC